MGVGGEGREGGLELFIFRARETRRGGGWVRFFLATALMVKPSSSLLPRLTLFTGGPECSLCTTAKEQLAILRNKVSYQSRPSRVGRQNRAEADLVLLLLLLPPFAFAPSSRSLLLLSSSTSVRSKGRDLNQPRSERNGVVSICTIYQ